MCGLKLAMNIEMRTKLIVARRIEISIPLAFALRRYLEQNGPTRNLLLRSTMMHCFRAATNSSFRLISDEVGVLFSVSSPAAVNKL